jgi:hypothetical protein
MGASRSNCVTITQGNDLNFIDEGGDFQVPRTGDGNRFTPGRADLFDSRCRG